MSRLARPLLRLVVGPVIVAAFAGFELRHTGAFVAVAGAWLVFTVCIFTLSAWEEIQLTQTECRLKALPRRRSSRTR